MSDSHKEDNEITQHSSEGGDRYDDHHSKSNRGDRVSSCTVAIDGVCGMHNVIEERRNSERNRLTDLKKDFADHEKQFYDYKRTNNGLIANLCTFKNRTLGVALLGTLVMGGSFAYTYTHITSSDNRYQNTASRIDRIEAGVNENKTNVAVLVYQIQTTNERLREVISLMQGEIHKSTKITP